MGIVYLFNRHIVDWFVGWKGWCRSNDRRRPYLGPLCSLLVSNVSLIQQLSGFHKNLIFFTTLAKCLLGWSTGQVEYIASHLDEEWAFTKISLPASYPPPRMLCILRIQFFQSGILRVGALWWRLHCYLALICLEVGTFWFVHH